MSSPDRPPASPKRPGRFASLALGAAAALALVTVAVLALGGGGGGGGGSVSRASGAGGTATATGSARPAGRAGPGATGSTRRHNGGGAPTRLASTHGSRGLVADPEAAQSSPLPAGSATHVTAITPGQAALATTVSPGAPSDAQVKAELQQMQAAQKAAEAAAAPGGISAAGTVTPPRNGPAPIARVIAGANAIATFPYVFGGGHASFVDTAYDCSGSLSYALAAGGMLSQPVTSGDLMTWGVPGPGRYLTVFANPGHTFMYVDGLRYDTSGRSGVFGSRWQTAPRSLAGFVVRHWPGL
ncbi:MAG: peptidoglycan DL-endopeptidase CwlO [Solirubrobacteraceae bacterium]|nr:peptidoglycan DL-endopeptidase CwlO [Solirubrobacteraceae bacterium]